MYSAFFNSLSKEGQILVHEAMEMIRPGYDAAAHLVGSIENGRPHYSARGTMYYALGLMLLEEPGCAEEVEAIVKAVAATQYDTPKEIFHGCFDKQTRPACPEGVLDYERLGLYGRYYMDVFYERMADAFRLRLADDPALAEHAAAIERHLNLATVETQPVVWTNYEPNSREFVLMCYAMLLEHFSDQLSEECIRTIEHSSRIGMEGAVIRSKTRFSPLNTNIQCMHVFLLDYFGVRFGMPEYCAYAVAYAEMMVSRYLQHHAAAEYNSPTYCGVDLATLGFWGRYGSNERLKELGAILESGIWQDMMTFYNPAMMNFCGPYSRAYELEMGVHTNFHAMLYWALGEEKFPLHPVTEETNSNPLMVFGAINLPPEAERALTEPKEDVVIRRQFRELSERADPENNDALCTATAWITPDLMTGALSGSENPSHQLHPLVVFWRGEKGLGTIKVLRSAPDGDMQHMHTVLFDGTADREHLTLDVDFRVNRDVKLFFEIEYPGVCDVAQIARERWQLPGLTVALEAKAPDFFLEKSADGNILKVCCMSRDRVPETKQMHFDMKVALA